eukprot:11772013-Alexandrium_andersonii.AAC.1
MASTTATRLSPGSDLLRGPEGTTGAAALDWAIEAAAQAGLANRHNTELAAECVHTLAQRPRAGGARRHHGDHRALAALRAPLWGEPWPNSTTCGWGGADCTATPPGA